MPIILRDLPFSVRPTTAVFEGRHVTIKADQIVIWVGTAERGQAEFPPSRPFFPAVLDTGNNHNFAIREDHLIRWAGLDPRYLDRKGEVWIAGDRLPLFQADVWLRPNAPGERDRPADQVPFCLNLNTGIAVYPPAIPRPPRLPVLGLRAVRWANLPLTIDGRRRLVTLRTTPRYWFF